jgi:predicted nucleic acid-binding protein
MEEAVNIALAYGISAYDASYVALSQQVDATLLTLDEKLVRAIGAASYDVRSFNDFTIPPLPSV